MVKGLNIALVGSAPSSVRLAPYGSPDWQIWACSPGVYGVAPRTDVFFELHRYEPGQPWFSPEYCQFLANHPRVIVSEERKEIPNGVVLPVEELVRKYTPYWFTSSLAWMFAMAIEAGAEKIGFWGVDMAATDEYLAQKPALMRFAERAIDMGIEVGTCAESCLFCPPPLYGVSELYHSRIKLLSRKREIEARINANQSQSTALQSEHMFLRGALDDLQYMDHTWSYREGAGPREFLQPMVTFDSNGAKTEPAAP